MSPSTPVCMMGGPTSGNPCTQVLAAPGTCLVGTEGRVALTASGTYPDWGQMGKLRLGAGVLLQATVANYGARSRPHIS